MSETDWAWDDHYPSGVHGMDGYDYVSCSCGWTSDDKLNWPDHIRAMGADSLDAAWAEAEAALPEGYELRVARQRDGCIAEAIEYESLDAKCGEGPTPAAALRALAAKLREAGRG